LFFSPHIPSEAPLLFIGWTLIFEMFFYTVFAIALLAKRRFVVVAGVSVSLIFFSVIFGPDTPGLWVHPPSASGLTYLADPVIIEFVFGMMIALVYRAGSRLSIGLAEFVTHLGHRPWTPASEQRNTGLFCSDLSGILQLKGSVAPPTRWCAACRSSRNRLPLSRDRPRLGRTTQFLVWGGLLPVCRLDGKNQGSRLWASGFRGRSPQILMGRGGEPRCEWERFYAGSGDFNASSFSYSSGVLPPPCPNRRSAR
jgi:hypothetical protein